MVVALVAPFVEELTYRGLGYAAVRDAFGAVAAILVTSIAFGLAHGLVVALPQSACGPATTARLVRYLAGRSARQCGPCLNGLPALAGELEALATGALLGAMTLHRLLLLAERRRTRSGAGARI